MIKVINIKDAEDASMGSYDDESNAFFSDSDKESIMSGGSVVQALSKDPMFLVLTKFLVSKRGNNIADILEEIKDHLAFIRNQLT